MSARNASRCFARLKFVGSAKLFCLRRFPFSSAEGMGCGRCCGGQSLIGDRDPTRGGDPETEYLERGRKGIDRKQKRVRDGRVFRFGLKRGERAGAQASDLRAAEKKIGGDVEEVA